jgi:hypothetical protein
MMLVVRSGARWAENYTKKNGKKAKKTYNSRYSLVVTDPTTNPPVASLTMGERTGSRIV